MDNEKRKRRLELIDVRKMLTLAGAGCIIVLFYLLIGKLSGVFSTIGKILSAMTPIIFGFVIAFLLNPIVNRFRVSFRTLLTKIRPEGNKKKISSTANTLAVVVALLFFLAVLTAFFWVLLPSLYESINSLYTNIDRYATNIDNFVNKLIKDNPDIINVVNNYMDDLEGTIKTVLAENLLPNMDSIVTAIRDGIVGGLKLILNFVIGIIAAVYILLSKDKFSAQFKKIIYAIFDMEMGNKVLASLEYADGVFSGFIGGKILDSIIVGFICYAFCAIVQMPYAILISVIVGITNIIPFFGPFIGAIPSAILVFVESPKMCIVFIIFILILQQIDGNVIGPLILSDSTGLSSFWVLFAILVGGNLFGPIGMVLGVPTFACIYAILTRHLRDSLNKKGLENDTDYFVALRGFDENGEPIRGPKVRFESERDRKKRLKNLERLQHSKDLINKVSHNKDTSDTEEK